MSPVWAFGSEAQKQRYLPERGAGRAIGCFGLTEPDFGSNPSGMLTTAVRTGAGYKITGTKRWITNGSIAHVALVWAKLDGRVHGFLAPARFRVCSGAVGAGMACYEEGLPYAQDRVQFKKPIAGYQLVQRKLVDMVSEITKAQLMCWRLGRLKEADKLTAGEM